MAGTLASEVRHNDDDCISESNATHLHAVPEASVASVLPKVSYSISLSDWANPNLQSLHANLASLTCENSKAWKTSEKDSWSESAAMTFRRNASITNASHPHFIKNDYVFKSPDVDYTLDQEKKRLLVSSIPSCLMNNMHLAAAEGPSIINSSAKGIEKPSGGFLNSQVSNLDVNKVMQQSLSISHSRQPSTLMPKKPMTLLDLNVVSEVRKVDDADRVIPDCCSPSRKSGGQICMPDNKVSESGWTRYLDQSTDLSARGSSLELSCPESRIGSQASRSPRKRTAQHGSCKKAMANFEDSSMASDASSGPEQPFLYQDAEEPSEDSAFRKKVFGAEASALRDDACTSKISCEITSGGLTAIDCRMTKRRRRDDFAIACPAAPDISYRKETPQVAAGETDANSSEGSGDNLNTHHQSTFSENDEGDLVDDRLGILQQLIPNSEKLDREEMLAVAIDYVKSLELKIKMFETAKMEMAHPAGTGATENFPQAPAIDVDGFESIVEGTALQEKGLCLMPVSLLGKAL
ncbi:hypothetical protein O6H91_20G030300 [Diphasiastrum complanatum]|uniref:Uncharacterized protein n=1 Tax=Diphasiastrum complanatum TaxID=34168 RepID=A0ACC2AP01_DIPCM|nr:hypothetical protein O6H91_20G030300 [Diphasiastrum complanatum]